MIEILRFFERGLRHMACICAFALTSPLASPDAYASSIDAPIKEALHLMADIITPQDQANFSSIPIIKIDDSANAPLARYIPNPQAHIEIADKSISARKDYAYLVTIQDRVHRPRFEQYLTLITFLNLANEFAHAQQDKNGSLTDFNMLYTRKNINAACSLYALQQYVSDIAMLEKAVKIERYFLALGYESGIKALHLALEKNELAYEYEVFREAFLARDITSFHAITGVIRTKREHYNMSTLSFCRTYTRADLPPHMMERAIAPIQPVILFMRGDVPQNLRGFYPQGRD